MLFAPEIYLALAGQVLLIALLVWTGILLARRLLPSASMPERLIASAILTIGVAVGIALIPGLLGCLHGWSVLTAAGLLAIGSALFARGRKKGPPFALPADQRLLAAIAAATVVVFGLPFVLRTLMIVPVDWDSLTYHLFFPATWIQEGKLSFFPWLSPYNYVTFYPQNNELLIALLMVVLRNDLLAEAINLPLIALTAVAVGALCVRLGGRSRDGWAAGLLTATIPALLSWGATGYSEPLFNCCLLSSLLFTVKTFTDDRSALPISAGLAGLAAGLAMGTKYLGLPLAALVCLTVCAVPIVRKVGWRTVLKTQAIFVFFLLASGGYWYLRNWLTTGNPIYPVPFLGLPFIDNPQMPWKGASILANFRELLTGGYLLSALVSEPGLTRGCLGWKFFLLLPLSAMGLIGLIIASLKRLATGDRVQTATGLFIAAAGLLTLYSYLASPYWGDLGWIHVNIRFSLPFFCLGLAAGLALFGRRLDYRGALALIVLGGLALDYPFLDLSIPGTGDTIARLAVIPLAAVAMLMILRSRKPRPAAVNAAVFLLAGLLIFSLHLREPNRYNQLYNHSEVHVSSHAALTPGAGIVELKGLGPTVAVTADKQLEFLYIYLGRRLQRRAVYVQTHDGPAGSYLDPGGESRKRLDRQAWLTNLQKQKVDALVVQRWSKSPEWPVEYTWAKELGFPLLFENEHNAVFRLPAAIGDDGGDAGPDVD